MRDYGTTRSFPLDGRYENETSPLREFFSEFAFMRTRARLELDYLSALSKTGVFPTESLSGYSASTMWKPDLQFSDEDACKIQEYEKVTRHDVKAIEYFLRKRSRLNSITGSTLV